MIELVFVIVILGILAAIAVPKFASTRIDAQITKGRSDIASIRSSIVSERQSRLIQGDSAWITALSGASANLFDGNDTNHTLLMYGISSDTSSGHWSGSDPDYTFKVGDDSCGFHYNSSNGKFDLNASQPTICDNLVK
jgi:general secretion pathway protein G